MKEQERRQFSDQFKREAVRLAFESGRRLADVERQQLAAEGDGAPGKDGGQYKKILADTGRSGERCRAVSCAPYLR